MKKIKSIKQLRAEKQRMQRHQADLEDKMRTGWREVKESMRPGNIAKDAMGSFIRNKTAENLSDDNILKSTFTYGISLLARKFAERTGERLGKMFKK